MEDKKILYIIIAIIAGLLTIGIAGGILLFLNSQNNEPPLANANTNSEPGRLPNLPANPDAINRQLTEAEQLRKDREFISSFWQPQEITFSPNSAGYSLPLAEIKQDAVNYRDFSRRLNIENTLDKLSQNGFVVIGDPFDNKTADWETSYQLIRDAGLPVLVTADSVLGLYQNTMHVVYKEIEQEIFYPSLWDLLKELHDRVQQRYNLRFARFGIESDLVTEANRLELAYLNVALQLLKPDSNQVRETISTESNFFSTAEAVKYQAAIPSYLETEVNQEVQNIIARRPQARSPIFLYDKNYEKFTIPPQYNTSEKLKNYYLAITWLNESLFPLWNKNNDCENCYLDKNDHQISFVAALLLSNDLAQDQVLKNKWANIYKSISFFKGLESNLTYLDYHRALAEEFGSNFIIEEVFNDEPVAIEEKISRLQEKINTYEFPSSLGGDKVDKKEVGLRLLRHYHLLENKLFEAIVEPQVSNFLNEQTKEAQSLFSACFTREQGIFRCTASALDLFNLLGNQEASNILEVSGNTKYENYDQTIRNFKDELSQFDQNTWHDNAYMAMLSSLQLIDFDKSGMPSFMLTPAWNKKSLNTSLGAWTDFHKEINFQKTSLQETNTLSGYFPYGYVEPQIKLYGELLSNVNMILDGFTGLQIISKNSKSYERLDNLKIALEKIIEISKRELQGEELLSSDYNFINSFNKQIRSFIGDIAKNNLVNKSSFQINFQSPNRITQSIEGLNYIVVVYPSNGELFLALGPVFDYQEINRQNKKVTEWQEEFRNN